MPHNIVETAREAGTFQTLLTAVDAAGLGETLADGGPFTVFAPTDDAFAFDARTWAILASPTAAESASRFICRNLRSMTSSRRASSRATATA